MTLTRFALDRTRITWVAIVVLVLAGLSAFRAMPQQMDPGFTVRNAQVVTMFPGASPDRVEQLVTDPIEQAVQAMPELDFIASSSRTGVSVVTVAIREEFKEVRPIFDSLRRKVDGVRSDLPSGVRGPTVNDELGDIYPIMVSMVAEGWSDRELTELAKTVRDELLRLDGVGKVEILGLQDERVFVEYSNARLNQLGLSPRAIENVLQGRNIIMPGGEIELGRERIALEPSGNFLSVDELRQTLVALPGGGVAYLGDITTVRRGYVDPPTAKVRLDGERAVTFAVSMTDGDNLVELGASVQDFFRNLEARSPWGIDFETSYFQPSEVESKVSEFLVNVLQAVGIVLAVMLMALGLRTGIIVSALIPSAMVITMFFLSLIGETINQMSLAALIIALGLLVDNAIVVSEAIMVRMQGGQPGPSAAVDACKELQGPLLVSSLTTAAAFLPIYLAESAVGEYTGALFTVVTTTLLVSWGLALTMTPLLCRTFLRPKPTEGAARFDTSFYRLYRASLQWVLTRRWLSLAAIAVVFVASMQLWQFVPQIFFPKQERPFFMAELSLPAGTRIETTEAMAADIDRFLAEELLAEEGEEGVTSWTTFIGKTPVPFTLGFAPSPSRSGYCELMVHTTSDAVVGEVMARLEAYAIENHPDVQTYVRPLSAGPPVTKPVQIRISGLETDPIFRLVDQVKAQLQTIEGARNIDDNWGARSKKLVVTVDEERARRAGVTNQDVALALQSFLSGLESSQ